MSVGPKDIGVVRVNERRAGHRERVTLQLGEALLDWGLEGGDVELTPEAVDAILVEMKAYITKHTTVKDG